MNLQNRRFIRSAFVFPCVLATACGPSGNGGGADASAAVPDPNQGQQYTASFSSADGGTLQSSGSSVTLTATRGGVAADTQIRLNVLAPTADTLTSIYEFGPDGTRFTSPLALAIHLGAPVPAGQRAVLAFRQNGAWTPLPGSRVANGTVTANIRHFTQYSVINVAATPASSYARLYHYAALTRTAYGTVDLYLARGANTQLIASQAVLAGGSPTEITQVAPGGESATFFIVAMGAGPTGTRLWSQDVTLSPGQLYHVVTDTASTVPAVEDRTITASVRADDLADLEALPEKTLRISG